VRGLAISTICSAVSLADDPHGASGNAAIFIRRAYPVPPGAGEADECDGSCRDP
jgi:hypothetical protein